MAQVTAPLSIVHWALDRVNDRWQADRSEEFDKPSKAVQSKMVELDLRNLEPQAP